MATIERFEDLDVWQKARALDLVIFKASKTGPFGKDFEIRRASGSVMDNIAEGFERGGRTEFIQFLSIAKGSMGALSYTEHMIENMSLKPRSIG